MLLSTSLIVIINDQSKLSGGGGKEKETFLLALDTLMPGNRLSSQHTHQLTNCLSISVFGGVYATGTFSASFAQNKKCN